MEIPKKFLAIFKKPNKNSEALAAELNLALQSAGVGLWRFDISNNQLACDSQLIDLLDINESSPLASWDTFARYIHPEDREYFAKEIKAAQHKKSEFEIDFRVLRRDQSVHYLDMRGKTYLDNTGKPQFMTGVCWDMTGRHLAEEELRQGKTVAEDASRLKTNFMAKVSHDLRSPLNGIIGFAELMYHGKVGAISQEHKEYLSDILMSARQLLLLINDVVDLAKVESGKMEFHPEELDLKKILDETCAIFQNMIQTKNIHFESKIDPSIGKINIDPGRFKQVIYNYVSNALKCTPDNGRVIVHIKPNTAETFCLEVEDTGIGIREEDMKRLFVEFQQLDKQIAKKYSGTGLGLALTKHVVEAQGGEVKVSSDFGKGSRFIAIFPRHY